MRHKKIKPTPTPTNGYGPEPEEPMCWYLASLILITVFLGILDVIGIVALIYVFWTK